MEKNRNKEESVYKTIRVDASTVHRDSLYVILFLTRHSDANERIDDVTHWLRVTLILFTNIFFHQICITGQKPLVKSYMSSTNIRKMSKHDKCFVELKFMV